MGALDDEAAAVVYGKRQELVAIYEMITDDVCKSCIENGECHCVECKVIDVKEKLTERLCNV